jgi:hypothetical protein
MKKGVLRLAAFAVAIAMPATSVQAQCWSEASVTAAKIRDLETMLMVAALRCRGQSNRMLSDYNHFVRQSRTALVRVNDQLRAQFAPTGGLNAYDRYVTSIANRYGAGAEGLTCQDMASILSAANAEGGSFNGLVRLANDAGVEPVLSGRRCGVTIATAK